MLRQRYVRKFGIPSAEYFSLLILCIGHHSMWYLVDEVRLVPYVFHKREILEPGPRDRPKKGGEWGRRKDETQSRRGEMRSCVSSGIYPHRLVSVGVDVARLSPGPKRVAWPSPLRTPPIPLPGALSLFFFPFQFLAVPPREMVPTVSRA